MARPDEQPQTVVRSVKRTYLYEEEYGPCFIWTLILAPCFMPLVWKYHVRITTSTLEYGYSANCMAMIVDRTKIETIEKIDMINPLCEWGGYGIRKQLPAWDTGYLPKKGPGIRIEFTDSQGKKQNHTLVCNEPDQIISILAPGN